MKSRKIALWSIAAVTSVFVLGALTLHALTDSDHLKQMARDHVRKVWLRELTVGKLSLSFTPMPEYHATDVSVSNPAWAHDKAIFEAKEINARVAILPLLTGRIVIGRLSVDDFKIHLQDASDGRKNWGTPAPSASSSEDTATCPSLAAVRLNAITLRKGMISFRNRSDEDTIWLVDSARLDAHAGWRGVTLDFRLSRDGHIVQVQGKLDDVSRLGVKDTTSSGSLRVQAGAASLAMTGQLPLDPALQRYKFSAAIEAGSLDDAFAFLGIVRRSPVALVASANLLAAGATIDANDLQLQLGKLHLTGDARITRRGNLPVFDARLHAGHIDWVQALLDAGEPPLPPKPPDALFHDNPLPWPLLVAAAGVEGTLRANIQSLKMRSGIELADVTGDMKFAGGRLNINSFDAKLLAGSASGSAVLDGHQRSARIDLHLKDTLLDTWFSQTQKNVPLVGGRMQVHAIVTANGKSMKELAASLTGPVTLDIGTATLHSKKLSDAETLLTGLTPFLSAKGTDQVDLSCIGAHLPFERGIARGDNIIGIRSEASQLLTSGSVDLRQESIDLHGSIRVRSGIALGVSTFANKVKIEGKLSAPSVGLDKAGAPGVITRIAAVIFTGGASIIGTTLWDGARAAPNPCLVALAAAPMEPKQMTQSDQPARKSGSEQPAGASKTPRPR